MRQRVFWIIEYRHPNVWAKENSSGSVVISAKHNTLVYWIGFETFFLENYRPKGIIRTFDYSYLLEEG